MSSLIELTILLKHNRPIIISRHPIQFKQILDFRLIHLVYVPIYFSDKYSQMRIWTLKLSFIKLFLRSLINVSPGFINFKYKIQLINN